eukprot:m.153732 g.153732  ORF g.153732 m.153732 type:complete len:617 (+) comp30845_c0_seq1:382-2232(+)
MMLRLRRVRSCLHSCLCLRPTSVCICVCILGGHHAKCRLFTSPKIETTFVILSARSTIDFDVGAVGGTHSFEFSKRCRRWVVVLAVGVVLLARFSMTRPFVAAVVDFKVVKMPQRDPTDVDVGDGNIDISNDDLRLVLEGPLGVGCVVGPLEKSTSTRLRDYERLAFGTIGCTRLYTRSHAIPRERGILVTLAVVPPGVVVEGNQSRVFVALASQVFVVSPCCKPRRITSACVIVALSIRGTCIDRVRGSFVKPPPRQHRRMVHRVVKHLRKLLQLELHEHWVLCVFKRDRWTDGLRPEHDPRFVESVHHAWVVGVVRTPHVVRVSFLEQSNVSVNLIVRWARGCDWPLGVVVPSNQLGDFPVDGEPCIFIRPKAPEAEPLRHNTPTERHGNSVQVGLSWAPELGVRHLDSLGNNCAVGADSPTHVHSGTVVKCDGEVDGRPCVTCGAQRERNVHCIGRGCLIRVCDIGVGWLHICAPQHRLLRHCVELNTSHQTTVVPEITPRVEWCCGRVEPIIGQHKEFVAASLKYLAWDVEMEGNIPASSVITDLFSIHKYPAVKRACLKLKAHWYDSAGVKCCAIHRDTTRAKVTRSATCHNVHARWDCGSVRGGTILWSK